MIRARVLGSIMPDTPGARFLEQGCLNVDGNSRPLNRTIHERSELRRIREVLRFKLLEAS